MNLRTLGYVIIKLNDFLLDHNEDWGFGQWIRVVEAGWSIEEAPLLLNIYIVPKPDLKGLVSNFTDHSNTTMTLLGNTSTPNPANPVVVAVEYTGTALTRGNILRLVTRALDILISGNAASPCPDGRWEVSTPDGEARMVINVVGRTPQGRAYSLASLARGILELLYLYSRKNRWESSTATVKYGETLFATITVEDATPWLDGPGNGGNEVSNETATS